ncbi:hypothetical protein BIW11_05954, partial [Tropilaelaps mercedesae]
LTVVVRRQQQKYHDFIEILSISPPATLTNLLFITDLDKNMKCAIVGSVMQITWDAPLSSPVCKKSAKDTN